MPAYVSSWANAVFWRPARSMPMAWNGAPNQ